LELDIICKSTKTIEHSNIEMQGTKKVRLLSGWVTFCGFIAASWRFQATHGHSAWPPLRG